MIALFYRDIIKDLHLSHSPCHYMPVKVLIMVLLFILSYRGEAFLEKQPPRWEQCGYKCFGLTPPLPIHFTNLFVFLFCLVVFLARIVQVEQPWPRRMLSLSSRVLCRAAGEHHSPVICAPTLPSCVGELGDQPCACSALLAAASWLAGGNAQPTPRSVFQRQAKMSVPI